MTPLFLGGMLHSAGAPIDVVNILRCGPHCCAIKRTLCEKVMGTLLVNSQKIHTKPQLFVEFVSSYPNDAKCREEEKLKWSFCIIEKFLHKLFKPWANKHLQFFLFSSIKSTQVVSVFF